MQGQAANLPSSTTLVAAVHRMTAQIGNATCCSLCPMRSLLCVYTEQTMAIASTCRLMCLSRNNRDLTSCQHGILAASCNFSRMIDADQVLLLTRCVVLAHLGSCFVQMCPCWLEEYLCCPNWLNVTVYVAGWPHQGLLTVCLDFLRFNDHDQLSCHPTSASSIAADTNYPHSTDLLVDLCLHH